MWLGGGMLATQTVTVAYRIFARSRFYDIIGDGHWSRSREVTEMREEMPTLSKRIAKVKGILKQVSYKLNNLEAIVAGLESRLTVL